MNDLYPPESQRMDFVGHLDELRRRILTCLFFVVMMTVLLFSQGTSILRFLERPAKGFIQEFIFITPTEVFVTYMKVVFLAAFVACFPIVIYQFGAFLAPALPKEARRTIWGWLFFALVCFWAGLSFAYGVLLPAALKFLLSFGEGLALPAISIGRYASFAVALIFVGGCIFEIPVVIGLLTQVGILNSHKLRLSRRYAIFVIFIISAVITPTQDVFNLILFAVPMMALYEIGILVSVFIEKRKQRK